ncbi:MAG: carboxypeptidase regulatory-like domain-containing protein [Methanosphaera stadtmanae]|nr:carboxypeptidase regulatory-like domain-containing protein [Methanosphaera stadtmanae]
MMKNKIFSLCVIIFILLLCTTVSADNGVDNNVTVENITNIDTTTPTSDMGTIESQIISETADVVSSNKISTSANQISVNSNDSKSIIETVQSITENEDNSKVIEINSSDILKKSTIVNSLKLTANNVYSISGVVSCVYNETSQTYVGGEEDGLPVEGAEITLYNSKGDLVASTISSDLGLYDFADLNPDTYTVNFAYRTYANGSEIVTIRDRCDKQFSFPL